MKQIFSSAAIARVETSALMVAIVGILLKLSKMPFSTLFLAIGMGVLVLLSLYELTMPSPSKSLIQKFLFWAMPLVRAICQIAVLLEITEASSGRIFIKQASVMGVGVLLLYFLNPDKSSARPRELEKTLLVVGLTLFIFLGLK